MKDRAYKAASIIACLLLGGLGGALILGGLSVVFRYYLNPAENPTDSPLHRVLGLSLFLLPATWAMLLAWLFRRTSSWVVPLGLPAPLAAAGWYMYPNPIVSPGLVVLAGCAYALGLAGASFVRSRSADDVP